MFLVLGHLQLPNIFVFAACQDNKIYFFVLLFHSLLKYSKIKAWKAKAMALALQAKYKF